MKSILFFLFMLISLPIFAVSEISNRQAASSSQLKTPIPQPADLDLVEEKILLETIETAQAAVRNSPEDAAVWGHLGHVYLIHGWEVPAIPCYRRASLLAPDEFKWLYFLGRLMKEHQPEAAVESLTRALTLNNAYAPAHLYLAAALRILGRLDAARQHLEHAKRLQPNNPFSELWLGEIALARQQLKLARTHLESALRLNPRQSEAHALMAQVTIALGDKQAAKQHAHAARRASEYSELSDPLWWDVLKAGVTASLYAERGRRYMSEGDYMSAVAEFEPLISNNQKDMDLWFDYGIALLHIERYNEALAALERAQVLLRRDQEVQQQKTPDEISYSKAQVYSYIAQVYYETGRTDPAIHTVQKAIELLQHLVEKSQASDGISDLRHVTFLANVYANLARVYEDVGQLEQAIIQYKKALELLPTTPSVAAPDHLTSELHRDLAGVYWKQWRYAKAEPHYEIIIAADRTDAEAVYRLGLIFLTQGKYADAVVRFKQVIDLDAAHVHAYGALGIAYQKIGDNSKAIEALEKVLQLDPNNKNALEMLKQHHEE